MQEVPLHFFLWFSFFFSRSDRRELRMEIGLIRGVNTHTQTDRLTHRERWFCRSDSLHHRRSRVTNEGNQTHADSRLSLFHLLSSLILITCNLWTCVQLRSPHLWIFDSHTHVQTYTAKTHSSLQNLYSNSKCITHIVRRVKKSCRYTLGLSFTFTELQWGEHL